MATKSFAETRAAPIEAAQADQTQEIQGEVFARIPFGSALNGAASHCPDCLVKVGQLRVPGCALEVCPRCARQVMTCRCH